MRPNAEQLSMRDPAMAALMGVIGGPGSDFGSEDDFGVDFGDDDDDDLFDDYGVDFGDDDDDDDDDDDWGDDDMGDDAEFGAAVKRAIKKKVKRRKSSSSSAALAKSKALMKLWKKRAKAKSHTAKRARILEPNKGSSVKVEKYSFTISQAITLGTAVAFTTLTGQPDTAIRPQRVTMNAPTPMYAFIAEIKVANVSVSVGSGVEDAFNYSAQGVGQNLDMPTLSPANRASVLGNYTGFVPPGFVLGTATFFTVSFKGPASIIA